MISASRRYAESRFAMIEKRQQRALSEQDQQRKETDENTIRLRTLRLAKEESDRLAVETKRAGSVKAARARLSGGAPRSTGTGDTPRPT